MFISREITNFADVIQLQRHIEILLLSNDCVIVPDFGGFVTHYVAARYDESDQSFLPPMRTLGFNSHLRMNDSMLAQSYVEAYDLSYPEALRKIESEVKELKQQLSDEGCYQLDNLGLLTVNHEGNYEFAPCEAGILSPEFYGLDSITVKRWKNIQTTEDTVKEEKPAIAKQVALPSAQPSLLEFTDTDDDDDHRAITIKLSWIRNAVAVAAAIIAFVFIASPIAKSDLGSQTMSQLPSQLLYKLIPQDTNIVPAVETAKTAVMDTIALKQETESDQTASEKTAEQPASSFEKDEVEGTYCIVLASQVKRSNAEEYVKKLQKRGFDDARIYVRNNVVRVVFGQFENEGAAYQKVNKINNDEEFYEAWVLKI